MAEVIDTGSAGDWSFVIVSVDGAAGGVRNVRAQGDFAEWSPTGAGYGFATDGRTFYFTVGSHESDVWVMELRRP